MHEEVDRVRPLRGGESGLWALQVSLLHCWADAPRAERDSLRAGDTAASRCPSLQQEQPDVRRLSTRASCAWSQTQEAQRADMTRNRRGRLISAGTPSDRRYRRQQMIACSRQVKRNSACRERGNP